MITSIYAAYRGDNYVGEGTISQLATMLGVKVSTVKWALTPSGRRRACAREENQKRKKHRMPESIQLVLLEER